MTLSRRTFMAAATASAAGVALAACSRDDRSGGGTLDRVTYLTSFGNLGRDAYIHAAVHKNYFADAGIEVDVQYGQAGDYNHNQLLAGRAQFASIDAAGAIIRAGKAAKPEDRSLRIVGVVHQRTLNAVAAFADMGFTSPRDLRGKTLGAVVGAAPRALFPAFARLAGIDEKSITWIDATTQNSGNLLASNRVAALATQLPTKPGLEKLAGGRPVVMFPYSDFIADLYGMTIMTHRDVIDRNPDLVRRFNQAIMRGVKYGVSNPEEIGTVLHGIDNTADAGQAAQELAILKPNSLPAAGVAVGTFDEARMARNIALLQELGLIPAGLTPADVADTRFLPESDG
ncbi:ABC transporter substrate-binding protein [Catenuloplanes indicus]|uniref:NitT/TauT family transport system substrate-binding protein n=1 Tax=Catenuloplanes indicus TaxID=137267 RepID=A0AAE3VTR5_9ACTN|nr:ABC transporter substrate-binding protein [Catenuloplanes indicus]MDQ0363507.1 NitT/TauT family transport system substrate-binding protein [Catenuloplanes indicus]